MMEHVNKAGEAKIIPKCTLPLTGRRCIDMVITDLGVLVMNRDTRRFTLTELAPGVAAHEVMAKTTALIDVADRLTTIAA